jgi:hypothetical protein
MKHLSGIIRTEDFLLRLHTAQWTSLLLKLSPNPDGLTDLPTAYSGPYNTSLTYKYIFVFTVSFLVIFNHSNCAAIIVIIVSNSWYRQAPLKWLTLLSVLFVV